MDQEQEDMYDYNGEQDESRKSGGNNFKLTRKHRRMLMMAGAIFVVLLLVGGGCALYINREKIKGYGERGYERAKSGFENLRN